MKDNFIYKPALCKLKTFKELFNDEEELLRDHYRSGTRIVQIRTLNLY
jgi:hypothetical protein